MRCMLVFVGLIISVSVSTIAAAQDNAELTVEANIGDDVELSVPRVLDLEAAQRIALSQNPSLRAAETRIRQARQRVRQAVSLYFPQVSGLVSANKTRLSEEQIKDARRTVLDQAQQGFQSNLFRLGGGGFGGGGTLSGPLDIITPLVVSGIQTADALDVDESAESYVAQLQATWLLFDGFEREFNVRAARYGFRETEAGLMEAQRLLLSAVAATFYRAQLARENIAIAEADSEFNQRLLKEAEARRRVGTGPLSDVLNFEVQLNQARQRRIEASRVLAVSLIGLAELLGMPTASFPPDQELAELESEQDEEMVLPDARPLIDYAEAHRPDLQQLEHAVDRTRSLAKARRGPFYPAVSASWSKDTVRTEDLNFAANEFSTSLGLTVTYTFFAGGRNKALLVEAKEVQAEAEWNLASGEIGVHREVREALENLSAAQESLRLQRENAELVRRNRDLVEKGYLVGQESLVRLTQADRDYITAQSDLARALVSLRSAWHDLRTATGQTVAAAENW